MSSPRSPVQQRSILKILSTLSYRAGELNRYLQEIAREVSQLIDTDWSIVTICENGRGRVRGSSIDLDLDAEGTFDTHGTILDNVLQTGQPFVVDDATAHPEHGEIDEGYCAYLGIPLRTPAGEIIGTICSFQRQPRQFTEEEVQLVVIFAERAATAIDNYQLYQQQQQFNDMLEEKVIQRTIELRAAQSKLMDVNNQLEQKVAQRTLELQQANEQLQAEIYERKHTEAALRKSEEQLRQIAENLHQVLWMYSHDGEPIYISPAFEAIWQQPCQAWYGNPGLWQASIHPDDQTRVIEAFNHAIDGTFHEEYRIVRPDGSVRLISDQAFPICDASGTVYRLVGIAEDITDRKQTEQDRMQAIASLAEVGGLAAMIVHEIRNPLTTIWMGLQSFRRLELPEGFQLRLGLALEEGERLQTLLNEILLYAKPPVLQCDEVDLNPFFADLLDSLQSLPFAMNRHLQLVSTSDPMVISGDRNKLKQVFTNLIHNACEAVADGDEVAICLQRTAQFVQIQVHNGGSPIPPDLLPMLTKPFYTTKSSGTGLGLAIVKRIVEAHGGNFEITSSAEQGTIATVQFPQSAGTDAIAGDP